MKIHTIEKLIFHLQFQFLIKWIQGKINEILDECEIEEVKVFNNINSSSFRKYNFRRKISKSKRSFIKKL